MRGILKFVRLNSAWFVMACGGTTSKISKMLLRYFSNLKNSIHHVPIRIAQSCLMVLSCTPRVFVRFFPLNKSIFQFDHGTIATGFFSHWLLRATLELVKQQGRVYLHKGPSHNPASFCHTYRSAWRRKPSTESTTRRPRCRRIWP